MRVECRDLLEQIAEQTLRINARTAKIKVLAAEADTAQRLQTIPGVGPFTALAVEVVAPPMANFSCGSGIAGRLAVLPLHFSSGGKERRCPISKGGYALTRRVPLIQAKIQVHWVG